MFDQERVDMDERQIVTAQKIIAQKRREMPIKCEEKDTSTEMNARLMLDPHFSAAYTAAQKTIIAWRRYFEGNGQGWGNEPKLTLAALLTWMACAEHQGCANQLYEEMLHFAGVFKVQPVQIVAKWHKDDSLSHLGAVLQYNFDYSDIVKESILLCNISYNQDVADMFSGEEVLRAMVPLSIKWIGTDNWGNFVSSLLESHQNQNWCVHCHPVLRAIAEIEVSFMQGSSDSRRRPRMARLTARLAKRPPRHKRFL